MINRPKEPLSDVTQFYFFIVMVCASVLILIVLSRCSNAAANNDAISCQVEKAPIEWQVDSVCGLDKNGNQKVSVGSFENPKRYGCVSLSWVCRMN